MRLQRPDHIVRNGLGLAATETAVIVIGPMVTPVDWSALSLVAGGAFGAWLALTANSMVAGIDVDISLSLTDPERAFVTLGAGGRLAGAAGGLNIALRNDSPNAERVTATRVELGRTRCGFWQHLLTLEPLDATAWEMRQWRDRTSEIVHREIVDLEGASYVGIYTGSPIFVSEDEMLRLRVSADLWGRGTVRDEIPVRASAKVEGR